MNVQPLHGPELLPGGGVKFRVWAPGCTNLGVALLPVQGGGRSIKEGVIRPRVQAMAAAGDGWYQLNVPEAGAGSLYQFVLSGGLRIPDPASRFQPHDVHGPSEVIDPHYAWQHPAWAGRPWREAVIYELHMGAFTAQGTFRAAIDRLDHLAGLGVTAVEVMPVADFPGRRNWGYDGVLLYAPDSSYGRPEDFKAFVDAAHARGIMVLLDVVYNHFGPDGNHLPNIAPAFFTDRHHTPWGAALNFDGPASAPVREFVIQNAQYWIEEFHLDGLRLDAVHAIVDDGTSHLLDELAQRVRACSRGPVHLILENEHNQARRLLRAANGEPRQYTAQWNDDLHHVLHVAATGEDAGYYADYHGSTELLGRALAEGFAFQGQIMAYSGRARGEPSALLPPTAFVAFIQNHDQIGNRARGERISALAAPAALSAIASVYLLLPQIPMLFMGEEWHSAQPFPFFCDFGAPLAAAVREGRRAEFARFPEFCDAASRASIPDPQADATFLSAKLDWSALTHPDAAARVDWYRRILQVRRESILPLLPHIGADAGSYDVLGDGAVVIRWHLGENGPGHLTLAANLSERRTGGFPLAVDRTLWQQGDSGVDGTAQPWSVRWSVTP